MKLLIIGGTGVLSGAVVKESISQGIDVTIVIRGISNHTIPDGVHTIKADYHDENFIRECLRGLHFDTVIDFICYSKEQIDYSIKLLHNVAEQYVFISTTCVYDTSIRGMKSEESSKILKSWSYSVNKWECEEHLEKMAKELEFNYTIIRPCVTYDDTRIPYGIMPPYGFHWTLVARILSHKPIIRWNKGEAKWNLMRVEDFALGIVGIIGNQKAYGEAYNLSGDNVYSWNDVLNILSKLIGVTPICFDISDKEYMQSYPERREEISARSLDAIIDNSKIKQLIPFTSKFDLCEGLSKTIEAYKTENFQKGIDWAFDANTDRIISFWIKKKNLNRSDYKTTFVNYLGNASLYDIICYYNIRFRDALLIKVIKKVFRLFHKTFRNILQLFYVK